MKARTSGGVFPQERTAAIHVLRSDGWTLQQIGDLFGITRERVRQILELTEGPSADEVRRIREHRLLEQIEADRKVLTELVTSQPGISGPEATEQLGWTDERLAAAMTNEVRRLIVRVRDGSSQRKYSTEKTLEAIRDAWLHVQHSVLALSHALYDELVRDKRVDGPRASRVIQVFGTWNEACAQAGVPSGLRPRRKYKSLWTDEEILAAVHRYLLDPTSTGSYSGWDFWRRVNAPEAPSGQTLRNRFGSWTQAKSSALAQRHSPADQQPER